VSLFEVMHSQDLDIENIWQRRKIWKNWRCPQVPQQPELVERNWESPARAVNLEQQGACVLAARFRINDISFQIVLSASIAYQLAPCSFAMLLLQVSI
jgi:hypothetical protein